MAKAARKPESGILRSVHEAAAGLHRAGAIDEPTMRKFDALCLARVRPSAAKKIKPGREHV